MSFAFLSSAVLAALRALSLLSKGFSSLLHKNFFLLIPICHSALDAESSSSIFWIPAFAGMTSITAIS
jgi:hypothetical protein